MYAYMTPNSGESLILFDGATLLLVTIWKRTRKWGYKLFRNLQAPSEITLGVGFWTFFLLYKHLLRRLRA